jgi:hypothetical protein
MNELLIGRLLNGTSIAGRIRGCKIIKWSYATGESGSRLRGAYSCRFPSTPPRFIWSNGPLKLTTEDCGFPSPVLEQRSSARLSDIAIVVESTCPGNPPDRDRCVFVPGTVDRAQKQRSLVLWRHPPADSRLGDEGRTA